MKRVYRLSVCLIVALMVFSTLFASTGMGIGVAEKVYSIETFEYAVTTDDAQWAQLNSIDEMLEVCAIPYAVTGQMTTDALIDAVLDFPLLVNIFLYETEQEGIAALIEECDAYQELRMRSDASSKLTNRINAETDEFDREILIRLRQGVIGIWVTQRGGSTLPTATVKTPKGSSVTVYKLTAAPSGYSMNKINNSLIKAYPKATFVSNSSYKYNCHSYAWHSTSITNPYWMENPVNYMTDGSYSKVTSSPVSGNRVYYGKQLHSAVVVSKGTDSSPRTSIVKSKWGMGPVMQHAANYSPYSVKSPTYTLWKKN